MHFWEKRGKAKQPSAVSWQSEYFYQLSINYKNVFLKHGKNFGFFKSAHPYPSNYILYATIFAYGLQNLEHFNFRNMKALKCFSIFVLLPKFCGTSLKACSVCFIVQNLLWIWIPAHNKNRSHDKNRELFWRMQEMSRILALADRQVKDGWILESCSMHSGFFFIATITKREAFGFLVRLLKDAIWLLSDFCIAE